MWTNVIVYSRKLAFTGVGTLALGKTVLGSALRIYGEILRRPWISALFAIWQRPIASPEMILCSGLLNLYLLCGESSSLSL
jgi:hypothetical protein